ncbi:ABC transporter ATP-binding protein [Haloarcula mannanilytica]|uniref:ABC-type D-xylose/L-arabinose transporter n=1 Tax=Haloarcula mannanilytica TaxID=2509225 RepID=A0A4C2EM22_9EURY|nr:ABC transporter ATP-binding protein [Haloarcula mannanilytica]GCF14410.1 ABC transporter ATP-binding protein [Haloarcula mannanilytica]
MGQLSLENITKEFGDDNETIVAVDDLDIDIADGEFLILVGPSGCGKSTTLRCIAGLEQPTSGDIVLDGTPVTERKPKDRNMAMVFQNYALYPHMTARENMAFGLRMTTDLSNDEIDDRVMEAATLMGIEDLLEKKPGEMSGGQQQRVALGRAIVRDPEVFLMDEPLSNLDAKLRTTMRTELQDLQQDLDVTTIYVTHDQTEAMTMGDRIAILNDGELQQIGTPEECYSEPENKFVAGFIGSPSMNFFDVSLSDGRFVTDDFSVSLSESVRNELAGIDSEFVMGIRPEEILSGEDAVGHEGAFEVDVNVVEPLGDITYIYTEINGTEATISVDRNTDLEAGDRLTVAFPESEIHVFDRTAGDALITRGEPTEEDLVSSEADSETTEA